MRETHGFHDVCPIVGQMLATYIPVSTAGASPPPLRLLRSLLAGIHSCNFCGSALPSSGATFLFRPRRICMADMSDIGLSTGRIEFILNSLLRRAPYPPPSDPASQHRTGIVSSSLDPGSPAGRLSSSLAHCHYFGFGFGQSSGPVFGQGLFFLS